MHIQTQRRRVGPLIGALVGTLGGLTAAYAGGPHTPTASVSQNAGLTDHQVIQVSGSGFYAGPIGVVECGCPIVGKDGSHPVCTYYTSPTAATTADAAGNFGPTDFPVARAIDGIRYPHGGGPTQKGSNNPVAASCDCQAANDCFVRILEGTQKDLRADVPIAFAAP